MMRRITRGLRPRPGQVSCILPPTFALRCTLRGATDQPTSLPHLASSRCPLSVGVLPDPDQQLVDTWKPPIKIDWLLLE